MMQSSDAVSKPEKEINQLKKQLKIKTEYQEQQTNALLKARQKVDALQESLASTAELRKQWEDALLESERKLSELEPKLVTASARRNELQKTLQKREQKVSDLTRRLAEETRLQKQTDDAVNEKQKEIEQLKKSLESEINIRKKGDDALLKMKQESLTLARSLATGKELRQHSAVAQLKLQKELEQLKQNLESETENRRKGDDARLKSERRLKELNDVLKKEMAYRKRAEYSLLEMQRLRLSGFETAERDPDAGYIDLASLKRLSIASGFSQSDSGVSTLQSRLSPPPPLPVSNLHVSGVVGAVGGMLRIHGIDVELQIPRGALAEDHCISMRAILFEELNDREITFTSYSSYVVELLPNRLQFSKPVILKVPHCLMLMKDSLQKMPVMVYTSHHERGNYPEWKEIRRCNRELSETHCTAELKTFCWVKFEIDGKVVIGKKLKLYTAGRNSEGGLVYLQVGYIAGLPGMAAILRDNSPHISMGQCKDLYFLKDGNIPISVCLRKVVPGSFTNVSPEDNPKIIPYRTVVLYNDQPCEFYLMKTGTGKENPFVMFTASHGEDVIDLSIRIEC